jgi:predicted nucleic acid-binding protein
MPPAYHVRASVIDVRTDAPRATDRFLVDANVWAWGHYSGSWYTASGGVVAQAPDYRRYLELTRNAAATRLRIGPTLIELAAVVEHFEHVFYRASVASVDLKEYRNNVPAERARVVGLIRQVCTDVEGDSDLLEVTFDDAFVAAALAELAAAELDGPDALIVRAMRASGVTQILTDDGDFCTVAGVEVFTANPRVLAAARAQGRLLVR